MKHIRLFFLALFALVLAARLCHVDILWAEEGLPLAAGLQVLRGKTLYSGIWFDKPPLLVWTYLLWGARDGVLLRLAGAFYAILACWIAWRFARDLWGWREAFWAAGLMAFYLVFDIPSSVTPLAADLLMLVPHLAAVWLAWRGRAFWSGALAGVAFLINPKGLFVLAVCAVWNLPSLPLLLAGFAVPNALAAALLWSQGALAACYDEVWHWGRIYAGVTFVDHPARNGLLRTAHWMGFHAALVLGGLWFWLRERKARLGRWAAWAVLSFAAVILGWRFFARYYFQVLPIAVLAGARGLTVLSRKHVVPVSLLLLIPFVRFTPRYALLARDLIESRPHHWEDVAMDQDSREAARRVAGLASPGDTLFVWGFRPELYVYTHLPAGTRYLDSQPLSGVPADRHLAQSKPVETESTRIRRAEVAGTRPTLLLDGLGPINPNLAITAYKDLRPWLSNYTMVAATPLTAIYRLNSSVLGPAGE